MNDHSDSDLIREALATTERSFSVLVERYIGSVYNYVFRLVRSVEESEDITQETFVKVWKNLKRFREGENFRAWVFTIARNTLIDYTRKKKMVVFSAFENSEGENVLLETTSNGERTLDELVIEAETKEELENVLAVLSPEYREVILLHYQEDMTFDEIGRILKKSLNTVKSQHRRALAILRKELEMKKSLHQKV